MVVLPLTWQGASPARADTAQSPNGVTVIRYLASHGNVTKLIAAILQQRGENPVLAQYWQGYGLREHALYTDHDAQFWIDVLVRGGKLKPDQLTPEDVETNRYNELAHFAQQ